MPAQAMGSRFMETCNANLGKQTLKKRLLQTQSLIVLGRRLGAMTGGCEALSTWASNRRWSVTIVPGAPAGGEL
eukprot:5602404-Pyramimonas_sp.AAC.1